MQKNIIAMRATKMRREMTREEKHLWYDFLKGKSYNVYRQRVIKNYIADFCIPFCRLIIELDGSQHYREHNVAYDAKRTEELRRDGYTVIRFDNDDVLNRFEWVCHEIDRWVELLTNPMID